MNCKLNNLWILWYDKINHNVGSDDWDKFLVRVSSFETIEKFCNLLGKIVPLSQLPLGASYHIFSSEVEPRWEDKHNLNGGKWNLVLQKQNFNKADKIWFLTLTSVIGGSFKGSLKSSITGIVGTVKKGQIRIAIWTKKSDDKCLQLNIGENWKKLIQESLLLEKFAIEFFPHKTHPYKR
jgi:translation initiation factor 4E